MADFPIVGIGSSAGVAPQNLLQDPPFSRIDLISCRNLLIYLEPDVQKQLLGLFHFALCQGAHLFLGPAETISSQEDLFQPVSRRWRIYRRLGSTRHDIIDFPLGRASEPASGTGTESGAAVHPPEPGAGAAYQVDHPEVIEVEGEAVTLTPKQGLGLSLVLHELGTNAAKYGALSRHEGRLRISWQVEGDDQDRRVRLRWQERHGPTVEAPGEKGFGVQLIERACAYELEGEVELDYAPEGLSCDIVFPMAWRGPR